VATNAGGRGDYLWWSTGDNETLAWHGLDLRTLT
jgi:membrane-bound inhibitor of C-type lysozyme